MRPVRPRAAVAFAVLLPALGAGCARSAEERQLDTMRDEIDRLQQDRDWADRPALAPEAAETDAPAAPRARPQAAAPADAPQVVRLDPEGEPPGDEYADTEDTTPRPTIRVSGAGRSRGGWRGDDAVQQTSVDDGAGGSVAGAGPTPLDPAAKRAYDAALSLVNARQYDKALDALAAFLVKWPDHPYADNAMYWRGECYYAKGDVAHAAQQFEGVIARFPAGKKAPDALLKLGLCHQKLGDAAKAKECFDRLAQQYPWSDAARRVPSLTAAGPQPGPAPEDHR